MPASSISDNQHINKPATHDRLRLEKFKDEGICNKIEQYLENNLFDGEGNVKDLSPWDSIFWGLKDSKNPRFRGGGDFVKDNIDGKDVYVI